MNRFRLLSILLILAFIVNNKAKAENEQWSSLDGPYWVTGQDIACGGLNSVSNRYLSGGNGIDKIMFRWRSADARWIRTQIPTIPNSIISYKQELSENYAIGAVSNDNVYYTVDGGAFWQSRHFPQDYNRMFKSVEIVNSTQNPGQVILTATEANASLPSVYYTESETDTWHPLGSNPFSGQNVYDIETFPGSSDNQVLISAGTDNGIYVHSGSWSNPWTQAAFANYRIPALESIDGWETGNQIAAVEQDQSGSCKLYRTQNYWITYDEIKISPNGLSFNKKVRDISGVYWGDSYISCYVATDEGIYLLSYNNPLSATQIDFKNDASYNYPSLKTDTDIRALDYTFKTVQSAADTSCILAATSNNIYEIKEVRNTDNAITTILISEISTGTFLQNSSRIAFPYKEYNEWVTLDRIIDVSSNGILARRVNGSWKTTATISSLFPNCNPTDLVTESVNCIGFALASFSSSTDAYILYSPNLGETWDLQNASHLSSSINAIEFNSHNDLAYAGGDSRVITVSTDNGQSWTSRIGTDIPVEARVNDIYCDPDPTRLYTFYVAGSATNGAQLKLYAWHNYLWRDLSTGLENATQIYQICGHADDHSLYVATDIGVFKANVSDMANVHWVRKTDAINNPTFKSVVINPNELFTIFASTTQNFVYVSADSGRSWIEYNGKITEDQSSIRKLSFSQGVDAGVVAGTDNGVYFLPNVVKSYLNNEHQWGPGKIIVNGDVTFFENSLEIIKPCSILFVYQFDKQNAGVDPLRSEIRFLFGTGLTAIGTDNERIVFTSSRANPQKDDYYAGVKVQDGFGYYANFDLDYCDFSYGSKGFWVMVDAQTVGNIQIDNCTFKDMATAGIDMAKGAYLSETIIRNNNFKNCAYAIRVYSDGVDLLRPAIRVSSNSIADCDYGIYFCGKARGNGPNLITENNTISSQYAKPNTFGIYVTRYSELVWGPRVEFHNDIISGYNYGIYLSNIEPIQSSSSILGVSCKQCPSYGLYLVNSSPTIGSETNPCTFSQNGINGIYCNSNSTPLVRWSRIKENKVGGAYIESHDMFGQAPNFGDGVSYGNNSFYRTMAPLGYYDMKYMGSRAMVSARGNYWGEPTPILSQIVGPINYSNWNSWDMLPGNGKREIDSPNRPECLSLQQNFPNPFNPSTQISFYLNGGGFANLKIYNLNGQLVKSLISDNLESGYHSIIWDSKNENGKPVSSVFIFIHCQLTMTELQNE